MKPLKTKNNLSCDCAADPKLRRSATHLHLCYYTASKVQTADVRTFDELSTHLKHKEGVTWVRCTGLANVQVVKELCAHFGVDYLVVQNVLDPNHPSKIETWEDYNLVVTHQFADEKPLAPGVFTMPDADPATDSADPLQVSVIQGAHFLLTFQEVADDLFDEVERAVIANALHVRERGSDYLFAALLNAMMTHFTTLGAQIGDAMEGVEESLLVEDVTSRGAATEIQRLRRQYMALKRTVLPLKEQFATLMHSDTRLVCRENRPFLREVGDHLTYVIAEIDLCRETLSSLMDLYFSNNDLRMSAIMKRLTIVSTVFIPLTFLVGVWSMNFRTPMFEARNGYWYALLALGVIALLTIAMLRTKKWR